MDEGATGEDLYQAVMHRIQILRVFSRQAKQPGRLIDKRQVFVLIENLYLVVAGWGNKGIDNCRHQAARMECGGRIITNFKTADEWWPLFAINRK